MYWFNPYFLPCLNYHAKREKKNISWKPNWQVIIEFFLLLNQFSIIIAFNSQFWEWEWTPKCFDLLLIKIAERFEKKIDLNTKNNIFGERMSNFRILEKNIFKRGMNGLTKCWLILHFEKHQFFIKSIPQQVMFLVFSFLHFLCKSIHSPFSGIHQNSMF